LILSEILIQFVLLPLKMNKM